MKVKAFTLFCLLAVVLVAVGCGPAKAPIAKAPPGYERIRIVGGSLGAAASTATIAFSVLLNKYYPEIEWSSSTGASTVNTVYIANGMQKLGMTLAGGYIDAYGWDKVAESRIRTISPLSGPNFYLFVIPEDKPWKNINDVPKGSVVIPGVAGSAQVKMAEAWLSLAGLSSKDFRWVPMGRTEMIDAWRADKLDLGVIALSGPAPYLIDMYTSPRKFKAMGLSPEQVRKARAEQTFERVGYTLGQKEANLTQLVPEVFKYDVFAPQGVLFLGSRDDFLDEVAYKMAKTLDERHVEAVQLYSALKYVSVQLHIENAKLPMELHQGVARYYREKGYLK